MIFLWHSIGSPGLLKGAITLLPCSIVFVTYGDSIFQTKSHTCGVMSLNIIMLAMRQNICNQISPGTMTPVFEGTFHNL